MKQSMYCQRTAKHVTILNCCVVATLFSIGVGAFVAAQTTPGDTATRQLTSEFGWREEVAQQNSEGMADEVITWWLPVASHGSGVGISQWRTDLALLTLQSEDAAVELRLHHDGKVTTLAVTVPSKSQRIFNDVVGQMGVIGTGALEIRSEAVLRIMSRTYNAVPSTEPCYPLGTLGQEIEAQRPGHDQMLPAGGWVLVPHLTENQAYRSNIFFTNTSGVPASVHCTLFNGAGGQLAEFDINLLPGERKQENQVFLRRAGQTSMDSGYARIDGISGGGVVVSGSVVDNITQDPTTIPMNLGGYYPLQWVPVASHNSGVGISQWRTDLGLLNLSNSLAPVDLRFQSGGRSWTSTVTVPPHAQVIVTDVVAEIGGEGTGAIEVKINKTVVVTSRTYTLVQSTETCYANGTFGQSYASTTAVRNLKANQTGYVIQLTENANYRSNIAFTNIGTEPAAFDVTLFDGNGNELSSFNLTLGAGEYVQETRVFFKRTGRNDIEGGYARIKVTSGAGLVVSGSLVDNATQDPTTVPVQS